MKNTLCKRSGHEIAWDGRTVWVNHGKSGMSIGRFSKVGAEVHKDIDKQVESGDPCLECFKDPTLAGWQRWCASVSKNYQAVVPHDALPNFLRD